MRLRYTTRATAELDEVLAFIDHESPKGARRVKARMLEVIDRLVLYPESGRLTTNSRLRRAVVYPYPYLIYYKASATEVVIHGIRHSARRPRSSR
jgi:plasmid stabilization system protein ParE